MSLQIPCEHCGERPVQEFVYGEIPRVPPSITDVDLRDLDRGFMHENVEGLVVERWFHVFGCRRWVTVKRETSNDEIQTRKP